MTYNTARVTCSALVKINLHVLYITEFVLFAGSKNPDITLKIAEIKIDNLGKVSAHLV